MRLSRVFRSSGGTHTVGPRSPYGRGRFYPAFLVVLLPLLAGCGNDPIQKQELKNQEEKEEGRSVANARESGPAAPNFELKDLNDNVHRLSQYKGRVVLLDFWATWCPPCQISIPALERLHQKYKDKGLTVLGANIQEPKDRVKQFADRKGIQYAILLDEQGSVAASYAGRDYFPIPIIAVINQQGRIAKLYQGIPLNFEEDLDRIIKDLTNS